MRIKNMQKNILLTGSTDGIGLETAKELASKGHHLLLHGRSKAKLEDVINELSSLNNSSIIESYLADLSDFSDVKNLVKDISEKHDKLDVLINNAGIFKTSQTVTKDNLDIRFVVNTIAPYYIAKSLLPLLGTNGRVINLSSAAQASVDLEALQGKRKLDDMEAYAQSKLAITMWSRHMALQQKENGPIIIAVNPGSLLASKMVKEGFGVAGADIRIGSDILTRLSLEDEFQNATGKYFDNDNGNFGSPHPDALDEEKCDIIVREIEKIIASMS